MRPLARHLEDKGFAVVNVNYPSTKADIKTLAMQAIPEALEQCRATATIHFVTHSMGGILLRQYLKQESKRLELEGKLGRMVMLSPPNHGSEIVDKLGRYCWFKAFNGPAGLQLGTDSASVPHQLGWDRFPAEKVGIIAGNCCADPLLSRLLPSPNDGKVSVNSTKMPGMGDFLSVPYGHTFIMNKQLVKEQVACFLEHGRFQQQPVEA